MGYVYDAHNAALIPDSVHAKLEALKTHHRQGRSPCRAPDERGRVAGESGWTNGITKRFGAVLANSVDFAEVAAGEIHAIVGENGAGKSTLMKHRFRGCAPDAGTVLVAARDVTVAAQDAIARGVGMVHQHFMLVPTLTVAENVVLGGAARAPALRTPRRGRARGGGARRALRARRIRAPRARPVGWASSSAWRS